METKTSVAVKAFKVGDVKTALKIASDFRIGITKDERATLKTGYECLVHPDFYRQIGKDIDRTIDAAVELFREKFVYAEE